MTNKIPDGKMFISKRNLSPTYFALAERLGAHVVVLDTSNRESDGAGLPRDEINIFKSPLSLRRWSEGND